MRPYFLLRLTLSTALCALAFTGCTPRETAVETANRDNVLLRGIGHELTSLDPHLATGTSQFHVLSALFEGLVSEDPVDLHPVPGVAKSWDISPDSTVFTFHLRDNARWSNGDPVTAEDFVFSIHRALTPSLGATNASLLYILQGAEAFHRGDSKDFSHVGVQALDALSLRLTLEHPSSTFLSLLVQPIWYPVNQASIEKLGSAFDQQTPWALPGKLVGNGPFALTDWRHNQYIEATKTETYWDSATVKLQRIRFLTIDSVEAEERAFRAGQLHITDAVPLSRMDYYRKEAPNLLRQDPYLGTFFLRINVTHPGLSDVRIRQALTMCIDRDLLNRTILHNAQKAASSFTPPHTAGYTPPDGLGYNPDNARELLAEAGYPAGKDAPEIELLYNTSENNRQIAEALQGIWQRELGLNIRLANQELTSTLDARRTGNYALLRSSWIADYVAPMAFLEMWTGDNGNNFTRWSNSDYDHLIFRAARTQDQQQRYDLLSQAEGILLRDAPVIPLYHYNHNFLISPSVQGWYPTLLDHHPYKAVSLR